MDDFHPLEINSFFGINSKQSKAKLPAGFSSTSDNFFNIDLSTPGVAKTRAGSDTKVNLGYLMTRIWDWFVPYINSHYIVTSGETKVSVLDQNHNILDEDTGFTDGNVFDYLNYGDELFYSNGVDDPRIASIIAGVPDFRNWGIVAPTTAPTFDADSGTGITGTYSYVYTYYNSVSGHESSASPISADRVVVNKTINLSGLVASADPQVDKIHIYRTTTGGATYFYLAEISNGTTTYADNINDTALGSTEAPVYNDPPPPFLAVEEWDGVIWGFEPNSTVLRFSNTEFYTLVGNPAESFHPDNRIDLRAKIFGIRKSPNFNELWVHTSKGIYACVRTEIQANPYRALVRNSSIYGGSPYCIVNIYNQQWFLTEDWRIISIDSSGNINYESYNLEPDLNLANKTKVSTCQGSQYRGNNKNQFRFIFPLSGQDFPNRMLACNYLQRTPVDEVGRSRSVWEYHKITASALGVVKDASGNDIIYTGTTAGDLIKQDDGINDDGVAISWSFELGWFRGQANISKSMMPRYVVQYFNPIGDYTYGLQTNFDFGASGGQNYLIQLAPEGDQWDIDFIWDVSVWGADIALKRKTQSLKGVFSHCQLIWSGSTLDQVFEMHTIVLLMRVDEGFRFVNE